MKNVWIRRSEFKDYRLEFHRRDGIKNRIQLIRLESAYSTPFQSIQGSIVINATGKKIGILDNLIIDVDKKDAIIAIVKPICRS